MIEQKEIHRAISIATIEMNYWSSCNAPANDVQLGIQIGAMGAAANIIAAIFKGMTPDQFRDEVEKRPKQS